MDTIVHTTPIWPIGIRNFMHLRRQQPITQFSKAKNLPALTTRHQFAGFTVDSQLRTLDIQVVQLQRILSRKKNYFIKNYFHQGYYFTYEVAHG